MTAPITIPFTKFVLGSVIMWITIALYYAGYCIRTNTNNKKTEKTLSIIDRSYFVPIFVVLSIVSSHYAAQFYTGKTIVDVLSSLKNNVSLYNEYQNYFSSFGLATLSLAKVPAITAMLILKIAMIYIYITVIAAGEKLRLQNIAYVVLVSLAQIYFSLARGTSFELFEMLLLILFCFVVRNYVRKATLSTIVKQLIVITSIIVAVAIYYNWNISARYSFGSVSECSTYEFCLDDTTNLYKISQPLSHFLFKASSYFSFGIYYTSVFIDEYVFNDPVHFIKILLPFAGIYDQKLKSDMMCGELLDCGASWVPDVVSYVIYSGLITFAFFIIIFGALTRNLVESLGETIDIVNIAALYFMCLTMFSLPVGNFIVASSSNILCVVLIAVVITIRAVSMLINSKLCITAKST